MGSVAECVSDYGLTPQGGSLHAKIPRAPLQMIQTCISLHNCIHSIL